MSANVSSPGSERDGGADAARNHAAPHAPRTVLVTGASRGLGRAACLALLADPARRVVAVARDGARLDALASEAPRGRVLPLVADLDDDEALLGLVARAEALAGAPIDGLVCAAGIAAHAPLEAIDPSRLDAQLRVNLRGPLLLAARFAAARSAIASQEAGAIVFVGSTLAHAPAPHTAAYAASKAGLTAAARALALELAPRGVRVNVLEPGLFDTDMIRPLRLAPGEAEPPPDVRAARESAQRDALTALVPLGRLGAPHEAADAIRYLLDTPYATGTVLTLDGGLSLGAAPR